MTKLEKLRDELAIKHEPYGTININTNAENDFKSGWDECDKHWRAHCEECLANDTTTRDARRSGLTARRDLLVK